MDVRAKRERRIAVAEEVADLLGVPAAAKEHRRAAVAEAVEADPAVGPTPTALNHPPAEAGTDGSRL
jgi:hypothetical protein